MMNNIVCSKQKVVSQPSQYLSKKIKEGKKQPIWIIDFSVLPLASRTLASEKVLFIQDFLTILTAHAIDMGTCKKAKTHYYKQPF